MYIKDLMKKIVEGKNLLIIAYLLINIFFAGMLLQILLSVVMSTTPNTIVVYLGGFVLYIFSIVIALSPVGEFIIRIQTGCRALSKEDGSYINPLFREVYNRAKKENPSIPDDVQLFVNHDEVPNAFATGRKTICITKGLLKEAKTSPEAVKAVLGHEFGHISNKDTDFIMLISVGNLIVNGCILGIQLIITLFRLILSFIGLFIGGREGWFYTIVVGLNDLAITLIVGTLMKGWTKLGVWIVMKSYRDNEFKADKFAADLGYGEELCSFLNTIDEPGAKGLFATLESTHPRKEDRIEKLQMYGINKVSNVGKVQNEERRKPHVPLGAMGAVPSVAQVPVPSEVVPNIENIITCPHCNTRIPSDSKFCLKCGAEVTFKAKTICPKCGAQAMSEDFEYCITCGAKLHS